MAAGDYVQGAAASVDVTALVEATLGVAPSTGNLLVVTFVGNASLVAEAQWDDSGWEKEFRDQTNQCRTTVWWKVATGGEPSAYGVLDGTTQDKAVAVAEFEGPFLSPVTQDTVDHMNGGASAGTVAEPLDVPAGDSLVVYTAGFTPASNAATAVSDGFTERIETTPAATKWFNAVVASKMVAGPVTDLAPTFLLSTAGNSSSWLAAFPTMAAGNVIQRTILGQASGALVG